MGRWCIAWIAWLVPWAAWAQDAGPAGHGSHHHVHVAGRLATAAAQGSADEVVLPVTEVRIRRNRGDAARSRVPAPRVCLHPPVEIRRLRGHDAPRWTGSLTDCSGRPTLRGMAALALLAQPGREFALDLPPAVAELRRMAPAAGIALTDENPPRGRTRGGHGPGVTVARDARTHDPMVEVAPGARVLHPRLAQMLQAVCDHFPGHAVEIVSGYRPDESGRSASRHAHARAMDFRLQGVPYEELRDFARTLPDAGVGYYPNSVFIHLDVREQDEGHIFWTDYSGPGETPRYGHWPPTDQDVQHEVDWMVNQAEDDLAPVRQREWSPPPAGPSPAAPTPANGPTAGTGGE